MRSIFKPRVAVEEPGVGSVVISPQVIGGVTQYRSWQSLFYEGYMEPVWVSPFLLDIEVARWQDICEGTYILFDPTVDILVSK